MDQPRTRVATQEESSLNIPDTEEIKQDLALVPAETITPDEVDPEMEKQADDYLDKLLSGNYSNEHKRLAIDEMGLKTQQESAHRSAMLQEPIKNLARAGEDGGPIAKSLLELNEQVTELDPVNFDFTSSGFKRLLRSIPGIGKPIARYFQQYQKAQTIIDEIVKSLEAGRDQLKRDNSTLSFDQKQMRDSIKRLTKAIQLGQLLDQRLQYKLDREIPPEDERYAFIQEELLFPLRQRIMDLQQTLAVNQQGVMTIEIIIRNNRELMRGVDRAINVTVVALQVAVACAMALAHQKIVLDKIEALNRTTSNLITHTAERLKTQGVEIHKQASQSALDMEALERAFQDIKTAMNDISKFRQEALPQMANNILRLDQLTTESSQAIERMDRGSQAQSAIVIDVDAEEIT
ncbi:toxic anion resistance protein [Candidatus Poribacteria bacterium]|nr:toxic anion resistance protein [Candidatus Poribacteria bacterium]